MWNTPMRLMRNKYCESAYIIESWEGKMFLIREKVGIRIKILCKFMIDKMWKHYGAILRHEKWLASGNWKFYQQ